MQSDFYYMDMETVKVIKCIRLFTTCSQIADLFTRRCLVLVIRVVKYSLQIQQIYAIEDPKSFQQFTNTIFLISGLIKGANFSVQCI